MDGKVAIIHNGIIENASQLRLDLQAEGYRFASATDTEVAAKLLGKIVDKIIADEGKPDLFKAVRRMARMLEGAFTILATDCRQPDIVVGARHDSPLVVGLGEGRTSSVPTSPHSWPTPSAPWKSTRIRPYACPPTRSSSPISTATWSKTRRPTPWIGMLRPPKGRLGFLYGQGDPRRPCRSAAHLLGRFDANGGITLDEVRIDEHDFKAIDKIIVVACGTASYAGQVAKYAIEHWVRIPVEIELAHEFRYRDRF